MKKPPTVPTQKAWLQVRYSLKSSWSHFIVRALSRGTKRFGELKTACKPISQKALVLHLRLLESGGIVARKIYPQIPPKVEYTLTKKGKTLVDMVNAVDEWNNKNS